MKNPFIKSMPLKTDLKIRLRIFGEWIKSHKNAFSSLVAISFAAAVFIFVLVPSTDAPNTDLLVQEVRAHQNLIATEASGSVYHVVREVAEGKDKASYIKDTTGEEVDATLRVDRVDSYQHNDTAITRIESNETERPFEVYLSREHDSGLAMHHFGPKENELTKERMKFNEVHNITSLYETYTNLDTPALPVLPEAAQFTDYDEGQNTLVFVQALDENTEIEYTVDNNSNEVVSESVYITHADKRYEMTRTNYVEREMLSAAQFDSVFAPDQYEFDLIATANQS